MHWKKNSGFTLVEMLIVVSIIGLLAAIGIPYVLNAYGNARARAKLRAIAEVEKAKHVLTLPPLLIPGSMGLSDETLEIQSDPTALSNLCTAMRIASVDDLEIGGAPISIGSLSSKASY